MVSEAEKERRLLGRSKARQTANANSNAQVQGAGVPSAAQHAVRAPTSAATSAAASSTVQPASNSQKASFPPSQTQARRDTITAPVQAGPANQAIAPTRHSSAAPVLTFGRDAYQTAGHAPNTIFPARTTVQSGRGGAGRGTGGYQDTARNGSDPTGRGTGKVTGSGGVRGDNQISTGIGNLTLANNRTTTPITILANYFKVRILDKFDDLCLYHVKFTGENVPHKGRMHRRAVYCLITHCFRELTTKINAASDYATLLITNKALFDGKSEDVEFPFWDEDSTKEGSRFNFTATVQALKSVSMLQLVENCVGNTTVCEEDQDDTVKALNLIFSRLPYKKAIRTPSAEPKMACLGPQRSFALDADPVELGGGLVGYHGIRRSVLASSQLLLNVNTSFSAFYPTHNHLLPSKVEGGQTLKGSLFYLVKQWLDANTATGASRWVQLGAFLKGLRIRTNHLKTNDATNEKIYSVKKMAKNVSPNEGTRPQAQYINFHWDKNPQGAGDTSVKRYYATTYPSAPVDDAELVVNCGSDNKPTYFPVSVCNVLAGQPFRGHMTSEQKEIMVPAASQPPGKRADTIVERAPQVLGIEGSQFGPDTMGITFDKSMTSIDAEIFSPPNVLYRSRAANNDGNGAVRNGGWGMGGGKKLTTAVTGKAFSLLQILGPRDGAMRLADATRDQAAGRITSSLNALGLEGWAYYTGQSNEHVVQLNTPVQHASARDEEVNQSAITQALRSLKSKFVKANRSSVAVELVFVLLPFKKPEIYAMVKRAGDSKLGLHTICAVVKGKGTSVDMKPHYSYTHNLALKANLKFGGTNQWLGEAWGKIEVLKATTMFVGIDVTHPGMSAQNKAPSIAAVVSTTENSHYSQWAASIRDQTGDKKAIELVIALKEMLIERLLAWKKKNGKLPEQLIIYRDGGSEGFFKRINADEWKDINDAIASERTYGNISPAPTIALICALKRNSTRFFPTVETSSDDLDKLGNCRGGLFVDKEVTLKGHDNFFLQSHSSILGTAKPMHYVILKNDTGATLKQLAHLTHDFCHIFGRAPGVVGCHPAIYYADLACDRARVLCRRAFVPFQPESDYTGDDFGTNHKVHDLLKDSMYFV